MLRARQMWGGEQSVPGLREALGLSEDGDESRNRVDDVEEKAHALVRGMYDADWNPAAAEQLSDDETVVKILQFAATEVVPRLRQTNNEIKQVLHALDGGFIAAGPSGSPLRGLINVLPTGRNFYSVDPKAVPSRLAWETGQAMAESLAARYLADHGEYPRSVGLSVWGTRRHAYLRRRHRRSVRAPRCSPCLGRSKPTRGQPRSDRSRRARPPAHRRHRPHLRILP